MPADHLISTKNNFIAALKYGHRLAEKGYLVTYGIKPDRPETGYGYVIRGKKMGSNNTIIAYKGNGFTEKPSLARAKKYLKSKKYLWNSGIFSFGIKNILEEIECFIPKVYHGVRQFLQRRKKIYFQRIPDISIDYGVMEKSEKLCVVKGNFTWDDMGSWLALERYFKKDKNGNIFIGNAKGLEINSTIMYTNDIPLRTYGIEDMIIVVSHNGVLVCKRTKAPHIKDLFK